MKPSSCYVGFSLILLGMGWMAQAQENGVCPACQVGIQTPSVLTPGWFDDKSLLAALQSSGTLAAGQTLNVAPRSPLNFPTQAGRSADSGQIWNGMGELPNAFHRPWTLRGSLDSNGVSTFDPSFHWTDTGGIYQAMYERWASMAAWEPSYLDLMSGGFGIPVVPTPVIQSPLAAPLLSSPSVPSVSASAQTVARVSL